MLKKNFGEFVTRTLVQPFLLVFVFLYVFPTIGQGVGGAGGKPGESAFATVLVPGVVGITIMFQGIQAVAMQLATEFGYTREIEDRVQAPCPVWLVAVAKVLFGAIQGVLAAAIVFPIAAVVHARGVEADSSSIGWCSSPWSRPPASPSPLWGCCSGPSSSHAISASCSGSSYCRLLFSAAPITPG